MLLLASKVIPEPLAARNVNGEDRKKPEVRDLTDFSLHSHAFRSSHSLFLMVFLLILRCVDDERNGDQKRIIQQRKHVNRILKRNQRKLWSRIFKLFPIPSLFRGFF